jgi:hypothetical protein
MQMQEGWYWRSGLQAAVHVLGVSVVAVVLGWLTDSTSVRQLVFVVGVIGVFAFIVWDSFWRGADEG